MSEPTYLGKIKSVKGSNLMIEIDRENTSSSIIHNGRHYRIGQIGTFVKIKLGLIYLVALISRVSSSEIIKIENLEFIGGNRILDATLVGEIVGGNSFKRGVSNYPTIEEKVYILTYEDLESIYPSKDPSFLKFGSLSYSGNVNAFIDFNKLFTRHFAILGSTGSGKSNAIAHLTQSIEEKFQSSRIIIIDLHGEYSDSFPTNSEVFSISNNLNHLLRIPYWALSFQELIWLLLGQSQITGQERDISKIRDLILDLKKQYCNTIQLSTNDILIDSPIPFSINEVWYQLDRLANATYQRNPQNEANIALVKEGDIKNLIPCEFEPYGPNNTPPDQSKDKYLSRVADLILSKLRDERYSFLIKDFDEADGNDRIAKIVSSWINSEKKITIFDLSGIPNELIDIIVGTVINIIFNCFYWGRDIQGVGKSRPLQFIFEEAHNYLGNAVQSGHIGFAKNAARRIFKEGRKFGLSGTIVTQRPSEIDPSILSQCGTFLSMRITNEKDQGIINSLISDSLQGITSLLPSLRTGEGVVVGEAINIPSRIIIPRAEPIPNSDDPNVTELWSDTSDSDPDFDSMLNNWITKNTVSGGEEDR